MAQWNVVLEHGRIIGLLCNRCQTPEENVEAVIHEATLDYAATGDGRVVGRPKTS